MSVLVGRDKTKRDTYTISSLLEAVRLKQIRDDHKQQRDPDQFSDDYRDGFISTIVKNEDFDPIKLCEQITEMGVVNWLIDGKQRLTTIQSFVMGGFCLGQNIENPIIKYLENTVDDEGNPIQKIKEFDLRGKGYTDLPPELKLIFDNYNVLVVKHLDCTDDEIGYHIRRYNRQVNMNGNQKAITYINTVAGDIKKVAAHRFFKDCVSFKGKDRINGTSERIVIESLMFLNHFDSWKKDAKRQGMFLDTNSKKEDFESELFIDVNFKHYPLRDFKNIYAEMSNVIKDYDKLNHRNSKKDTNHLNKHAMHLIRLFLMGTELLEGKGINTYREKDREFLLKIRKGEFSYSEIFEMVNDYEKKFDYAAKNTSLKDEPDYDKVEELMISINRDVILNGV